MNDPIIINNYSTTLVVDITDTVTELTVPAGLATALTIDGSGDYILLTLSDGTNIEIVKATNKLGDVITIERAQDGTVGVAFVIGTLIYASIPAEVVNDLIADGANVTTNTSDIATNVSDIAAIVSVNNGQSTEISATQGVVERINTDLLDRVLIDPDGNIMVDPNFNLYFIDPDEIIF